MYDTILLIEQSGYDDQETFSTFSLSLLELDWIGKKMQKVHTFSFEDQQRHFKFQQIFIDSMDPMQFLLQSWYDDGSAILKIGRVHDDEILLEDDILLTDQNIGSGFCSLVRNTLYSFNPWEFVELIEACIYVTRLDQGAQTSQINLEPLPEQFSIVGEAETLVGWFAMGRFYCAVQDKKTKLYGIIWTSCETRN